MDFLSIAKNRQSCRKYDPHKEVEQEKIDLIIEAARLAPSACNSQPYHFTICTGDTAKEIASATTGVGINSFAKDVPVMIVISEASYNKTAALGAKVKHNDYRSIDIGIAVAYLTSQAYTEGLSTCILGWFDEDKIQKICNLKNPIRLVVAVGYSDNDGLRLKKRKTVDELVTKL